MWEEDGDRGEAGGLEEKEGVGGEGAAERAENVERVARAGDAEAERRRPADERQRRLAETRGERGDQHRKTCLGSTPRPCAERRRGEGDEAERGDGRQHRSEREEQSPLRLAPAENEPAQRADGVHDRDPE